MKNHKVPADWQIEKDLIEKNNLLISGNTGVAEVESIFHAFTARQKCATEHGTVVLAEMLHGIIPDGKSVVLMSEGIIIATDTVVRIEKDRLPVKEADVQKNVKVGFCLKKTRLRDINKALRALRK